MPRRLVSTPDRRLLVIFVLLITLLAIIGTWAKRSIEDLNDFRRFSQGNCLANQSNTKNFNEFITTLQQTTIASPLLPRSDKMLRVALYQEAKTPVPKCPPARGKIKPATDPPPPAPTMPPATRTP